MEIPVHILWGVAGFVIVTSVKIIWQMRKDLDAAFFKIRDLENRDKKK